MTKSDLINLELFVASPGDVAAERQAVKRVVEEIEGTLGRVLEVNLRPFLWEYDLGPGAHPAGPQGWIDAHSSLHKCDILVGIFSNRLGTPTKDGTTGTEHEVAVAFERWRREQSPHIMLYFSRKSVSKTADAVEQAGLLLEWRKRIPGEILTWQYSTPQDFERQFRQHLTRHVLRIWHDNGRPIDHIRFSDSSLKLGLVTSSIDLIQTNATIVSEAEEHFFATGSRGRDQEYYRAIERRLKEAPKVVHHRVLMGLPFKPMLKEHLHNLLDLRPPTDRSYGFQTLHIGHYTKWKQQAEVFLAGNEKRVLIVLPSREGIGGYNTALVVDDRPYVADWHGFVKQLYAGSDRLETHKAVDDLEIAPDV